MSSPPDENHPLLPPSGQLATPSRSKLGARRYLPDGRSEKAKGKQRAVEVDEDGGVDAPAEEESTTTGRAVTVIFSDDTGNLEVWVDDGESVGHVKEKIRHLRPALTGLQLRLIHAGRLLTDGILLLPWLRSLEDRVRRQAAGMGGDVGEVLRDVGLAEEEGEKKDKEASVYLHCNVGGPLSPSGSKETAPTPAEAESSAPRRRGFDTLLDSGLSPEDVANMRRQFYESRGEEVPDLGGEDMNDEHARALEEQWIEGDLTAATATTSSEGMYSSILHGLLIGFMVPLTPWFFFRDPPLPNFFDAEAEADERARREEAAARAEEERRAQIHAVAMGATPQTPGASIGFTPTAATPDLLAPPGPSTDVSARVSASPLVGAELVPSTVFSNRTQIGIVLGTLINILFGALRFLST